MPFWPFKRTEKEPQTPVELRSRLIQAAASGSQSKLRELCRKYKDQVAANADLMCKAPEGMTTDSDSIEQYVQYLGAVAQCLAKECDAPELWNKLCGTPESNPLLQWQSWYEALPRRASQLEHTTLIAEAREFIERARTLQGAAARQNEAFLQGRLGELLFHSGRVVESIEPFPAALTLCRHINDIEGQRVYLNNMLEANRYLGEFDEAIRLGREAIAISQANGLDCESLQKQVRRLEHGEPLCRVVLVRDGKEFELGEFNAGAEGRYDFEFRRNRLSLQVATTLTRQGNELATSGQLADALSKYQEAMEVDPYDPDPVYQSGMCLMELGAYSKAKESFEEVERLAPSWFQCRFHRWLAESLENASVTEAEFQLLRHLDDGGLAPTDAEPIAHKVLNDFPHFAPFYLTAGNICHRLGYSEKAISHYRKGLELAAEPDLESRLLCALAGVLPVGSKERPELVKRAVNLDGNLVAKAMATFIPV